MAREQISPHPKQEGRVNTLHTFICTSHNQDSRRLEPDSVESLSHCTDDQSQYCSLDRPRSMMRLIHTDASTDMSQDQTRASEGDIGNRLRGEMADPDRKQSLCQQQQSEFDEASHSSTTGSRRASQNQNVNSSDFQGGIPPSESSGSSPQKKAKRGESAGWGLRHPPDFKWVMSQTSRCPGKLAQTRIVPCFLPQATPPDRQDPPRSCPYGDDVPGIGSSPFWNTLPLPLPQTATQTHYRQKAPCGTRLDLCASAAPYSSDSLYTAPISPASMSSLSPADKASYLGTNTVDALYPPRSMSAYPSPSPSGAANVYQEGLFADGLPLSNTPLSPLLTSASGGVPAAGMAITENMNTEPGEGSGGADNKYRDRVGSIYVPSPNRPTTQKADEPYAQLILKAFLSRPSHSMTLQEIYQWFRENTTKGKGPGKGWQNSIRHNLSMNMAFTKIGYLQDRKSPDAEAAGSPSSLNANAEPGKKSTEWFLQPWAAREGVQSTTRYRTPAKNGNSRKVQHRRRSQQQTRHEQTGGGMASQMPLPVSMPVPMPMPMPMSMPMPMPMPMPVSMNMSMPMHMHMPVHGHQLMATHYDAYPRHVPQPEHQGHVVSAYTQPRQPRQQQLGYLHDLEAATINMGIPGLEYDYGTAMDVPPSQRGLRAASEPTTDEPMTPVDAHTHADLLKGVDLMSRGMNVGSPHGTMYLNDDGSIALDMNVGMPQTDKDGHEHGDGNGYACAWNGSAMYPQY